MHCRKIHFREEKLIFNRLQKYRLNAKVHIYSCWRQKCKASILLMIV